MLCIIMMVSFSSYAQTDSTSEEEEDFEQYAQMSSVDGAKVKTFCTSKILAQTPNRLIAIGYELFSPHTLQSNYSDPNIGSIRSNLAISHGLRIEANIPVVSNNKVFFSLGGSYTDQHYVWNGVENTSQNAMYNAINNNSIRNLSLQGILFKPLNEKMFVLAQVQGDYAGDWNFLDWQNIGYTKLSGMVIIGKKPHERKMWGLGISRTFRAGEVNYVPVFLYNFTAKSEKWGIEMLLPARADFRYNITKRKILRVGVELDGTSYRLSNRNNAFRDASGNVLSSLELRRSDIKIRAMYDFSIKNFYWMSITAGYRLAYRFSVDQEDNGEIFRGFGLASKEPYLLENRLGGAFYISLIVTLVSP